MKIKVENYTFDASEKQVIFTDYNPVLLNRILLIVNVTDNIIIYNFADSNKGGTVTTNVLTLEYDTTTMDDTDKLLIYYDDAVTTQVVSGTVAATNADITSCKVALELLDNSVDGNYLNVNNNIAGIDLAAGAGTVNAQTQRITFASDDPAVTALQILDNFISGSKGLVTEDNSASIKTAVEAINTALQTAGITQVQLAAIKTAVELIDNAISGAGFNITQQGGVAISLNTGVRDAGTQRVTIATNDLVPVSLAAETTKVIGTINIAAAQTVAAVTAITNALPAGSNAIGKLAANSGVDIGDVDVLTCGTITPGVGATNLGKAEDAVHASGDVGVMALAIRDDTCDIKSGAENDYEPLHTDAVGRLWTDPQGNIAHDGEDSGNPVKIGGRCDLTPSTATVVADNDRIDFIGDSDGVQVVRPMCTLGDVLCERVSNTDGASTASTVFGATVGTRNCITTIVVHNAHATTNGYVDIRDGTAGTILMTIPLPATGGAVVPLPVPIRTSVNTALAYDVNAAITTIYLTFVGFKSKVA